MKACFYFLEKTFTAVLLMSAVAVSAQDKIAKNNAERLQLADEIDRSIRTELLNKWYPQSMDSSCGGFLTTFTYNFLPTGAQDKMIVTQARHVWSNALASRLYPNIVHYKKCAAHGFNFLKDKMWDKTNGGFYTLVDRQGNVKDGAGKTAYGNAFGLYASAAWYRASGDNNALRLAKDCFEWLER